MPTLDVSEAFDPSFLDTIVVLRRAETINQHGRSVQNQTAMSAQAVVTAASANDLQRVPESQYMNKAISVVTQFRLQGPSPGYQPDEILWNGNHFVVNVINDYSHFGRGFIQAIATEIEPLPQPPIPEPLGSA